MCLNFLRFIQSAGQKRCNPFPCRGWAFSYFCIYISLDMHPLIGENEPFNLEFNVMKWCMKRVMLLLFGSAVFIVNVKM
jgi:hypothetical protein